VRLKSIKLAGFKSFVDPTSFEVPSQLVGVVGPNGCGKSNIIDAVRWVMGESRAGELRGESMQDVIFNGSDDRKPSNRASVELVFDNSLGRIGGQWGTFGELAVKRLLTRDGQSSYFINNQIVRRRDIQDLFLGTGLGPRAYAIIGQGTVSRIIEAKPDELRVFLEEAAGISRYKERRKETENRLSDTRENLTRVDDILRELNSQLEKLERQAEVAQQFTGMTQDRDRKTAMLWMLRRDEAQADEQRFGADVAGAQSALEEKVAGLRGLETTIEALRSNSYQASDRVNAAQAAFYEAGANVSKVESDLRVILESRTQLENQRSVLQTQLQQAQSRIDEADRRVSELSSSSQDTEMSLAASLEALELAQESLPTLDQGHAEHAAQLEQARADVAGIRQSIEVTATRQAAAEQMSQSLRERLERLQGERRGIQLPDQSALAAARAGLAQRSEDESLTLAAQEQAQDWWQGLQSQRDPAQTQLRESQDKLARIEARLAALRDLQARSEGQTKLDPWLVKHGLDRLGKIWQRVRVEPGWETALEAVLRERLNAREVQQLDRTAQLDSDLPPGKVAFYDLRAAASATLPASLNGMEPLAKQVHSSDAGVNALLGDWLAHCYCASSLAQASSLRANLPAGTVLVTKAGHVVTRNSLQFFAAETEREGFLGRQAELESLEKEQRAQRLMVDETRSSAVRIETGIGAALAAITEKRDAHSRVLKHLADERVSLEKLEQALSQANQTTARLDTDIEELKGQIQEQTERAASEQEAFEGLDMELAESQEKVEVMRDAHEQSFQALDSARQRVRDTERAHQEASFAQRSAIAERSRLELFAQDATSMLEQAQHQLEMVVERVASLDDGQAREILDSALSQRSEKERALGELRQLADDVVGQLRAADEGRFGLEREQDPLRQRISELQLKEQAARINAAQFIEQLTAAAIDEVGEVALRQSFEQSITTNEAGEQVVTPLAMPKPSWLQGEVTRLNNLISGLGAVNLAALDELKESSERKQFLDQQMGDLNEAIATLEDAIRKIDEETRTLLQGTFDAVNKSFGELFPKLFGGGEARLQLTGEELLDAGVQVMAQPPGKKNATIHLLSGGEKALTAIALVFAMFQLNPAPFCLLDEVDAPLDDANTERYANLVKQMAEQTQFLFISHNKIAMGMADQLIGVTMQEKGVSRIVAVDLSEATQLAEVL
jgi:chromosome segregation protein